MAAEEQWRCVVGYEPTYLVSDAGRVANVARRAVVCTFIDAHNHFRLCLSRDGIQKTFRVDVLVAEAFIGPRPPGHVVRHLDGDTLNCRPENLAWVDAQEHIATLRALKEPA